MPAAYKKIVATLTAESGPFAVQNTDIGGKPFRVFAHAPRNLNVLFARAEAQFSDLDLVDDNGKRWTYKDIFARAKKLAGALQNEFGISAGDNIGLVMSNQADWITGFLAITWVGGVAVLFNSRGTLDELAHATGTVECAVIIADARRASLLIEAGVIARLIIGGLGETAAAPAISIDALMQHAPAERADVAPDAPAAILFTSGTTGRPRGAVLTHRNLTNMAVNLQLMEAAGLTLISDNMGVPLDALQQMMPRKSIFLVFPFFHISGITNLITAVQSGGMLCMIPRWRSEVALELIAANKVTMISGPPLVIADLLEWPDAADKMASINSIAIGGQATPASIVSRISRMLPMAGQSSGWGMTEVSGSISAAAGAVFAAQPGSCGLLSPLGDLRVVDEMGHDVPQGATGEIWLRSALVMQKYWGAPEATAATFEGEWYKTGDIGLVDEEGFIFLVDRKRDMVISGGENIYCAEVERALSADEALAEISIFGVPDPRLGERAIAAITLREGCERSEEDVKALARKTLAEYKIPAAVVFDLGPFPRNATGKVNKLKLRAAYLERLVESF
jgi:acyl-CoA synthetase (AMP-forming)/AMP-acid ligase II